MRALVGAVLVFSFGLVLVPAAGFVWLALLILGGAAFFRFTKRGTAVDYLRQLDDLIFEGEKAIVSVSLLTMALAVFVDVVWRTSHSVSGQARIIVPLAGLGLCLLGGLTARWEGKGIGPRLLAGLGAFVFIAGLIAIIHIQTNGFGWAQRLALVQLLWVGMLGGSMATKEGRHIAVDAVKRVVPKRFARAFEFTGALITTLLAVFLTILGVNYATENWVDYFNAEGRAFVFESLPIPYWLASIPIPIGFGLMAARFLGVAIYGAKEVDLLTAVGAADLADDIASEDV